MLMKNQVIFINIVIRKKMKFISLFILEIKKTSAKKVRLNKFYLDEGKYFIY